MKGILETDYDVKHYQNCLAQNLQLIDNLTHATRVTIQKEEWESPMLTVYRGDKRLGEWVIDRYPKTRQGIQGIAHKRIVQQINEIKTINEHINEELDLYKVK